MTAALAGYRVLELAGLGVVLGLVSGYHAGWLDSVIMRVMDGLLASPSIVLAFAITAALGPSLRNAMIAIGVIGIPGFARLVRGQVLALRSQEFVEAARALGAGDRRIVVRHIVPGTVAVVVIHASLRLAFAVLTEAGLSFLGLGAQPPTPSWGAMLNTGREYLEMAPWLSLAVPSPKPHPAVNSLICQRHPATIAARDHPRAPPYTQSDLQENNSLLRRGRVWVHDIGGHA